VTAATQEIRFVPVTGGRVAVAVTGDGPPLVLPPAWVGHLEHEWEVPQLRAFLTTLGGDHTVIRYDRLGVGLSDPGPAGGHADTGTEAGRLAELLDGLGLGRVALLGLSWGGSVALTFAARHPDRVSRVATVGALLRGADVAPAALRAAIAAAVRAHWGAGARVLADIWIPNTDAATRDTFARLQRVSASAEVAASSLEAVYETDLRPLVADVAAPVLVAHRHHDRAVPFASGRDLAAGIPGARFVPLDGDVHLAWLGDTGQVLDAVLPFLREAGTAGGPGGAPDADVLTDREREVLRLVADGLADAEIAVRLQLSPHTVHRHVANIRAKLGEPSRAAAVAHAGRLGLI
jgi:pimeloyl-ACP methyl ester carboxylesterase/DNA-binding CsgD family transcriptional regulator